MPDLSYASIELNSEYGQRAGGCGAASYLAVNVKVAYNPLANSPSP